MSEIASTHVRHGDEWFLAVTYDRKSSAAAAYGAIYAETMVWRWDVAAREMGTMVHTSSAAQGSIREHLRVVGVLHKGGLDALDETPDSDTAQQPHESPR